jgi:two-component system response regulator FlrC
MKILVVDDEAEVRGLIQVALTRLGHSATVAANGAEALALLGSPDSAIEAIFTDLRMPGMGGSELIQKLQAASLHIPVVLITGQVNVDAADAKRLGARHILHKPFRLADLVEVLNALAQKSPPNGS